MSAPIAAQLRVQKSRCDLPTVLERWFVGMRDAIGDGVPEALKIQPMHPDGLEYSRPGTVGPAGSPWGMISMRRRTARSIRKSHKVYSPANWVKFTQAFDADLLSGDVHLSRIDATGRPERGCVVGMETSFTDPDWCFLEAIIPVDWFAVPDNQARTLAAMRAVAELCDPAYGQVGPLLEIHRSALEGALAHVPDFDIAEHRTTLHGYAWLTVCSQEIGDQLGGLDGLAGSGAFVEATKLAAGGYWLLATHDYGDYDLAAATKVFTTVARKLMTGMPRFAIVDGIVVARDAAELQDIQN
ncbi:hypothetical protein [Dactylosporangium sp. NPDC048998]|uniref:hypothetical protein n=1 Tax=Dactylosporangium sp. NPDC048998 TaxID=3363976 RepID=UPI00370FFDAC